MYIFGTYTVSYITL